MEKIRQACKATVTHIFQGGGVTEAKKKIQLTLITIKRCFLKNVKQPSLLPVAFGFTCIENTVLFGRKEILIKESRRKKEIKKAVFKLFNYKLWDV